jgi:metal-responsive CopG/Arc/MetJ family transcriptional regulator
MKTAISVPNDLFTSVEKIADELHVSRSHIFSEAVRDYVKKWQNQKILEDINSVYAEAETDEERDVREKSKRYYVLQSKTEKW